jgi:hypothetical protein
LLFSGDRPVHHSYLNDSLVIAAKYDGRIHRSTSDYVRKPRGFVLSHLGKGNLVDGKPIRMHFFTFRRLTRPVMYQEDMDALIPLNENLDEVHCLYARFETELYLKHGGL